MTSGDSGYEAVPLDLGAGGDDFGRRFVLVEFEVVLELLSQQHCHRLVGFRIAPSSFGFQDSSRYARASFGTVEPKVWVGDVVHRRKLAVVNRVDDRAGVL